MSSVGRFGFYNLPDGPDGCVYVPAVFNIPEYRRIPDNEVRQLFTSLLESIDTPQIAELRSRLTPDADLIARPFRWVLVPAPWYKNRTILIGDAAHATTSHLGMGGGMALEDAVVLAQCVRDENSLTSAFSAFMRRRWDRVSVVVETSVALSKMEQTGGERKERIALMSNAFKALQDPY